MNNHDNTARVPIPGPDDLSQSEATIANSAKRQEQHLAWLAYHAPFYPEEKMKYFGDDLIAYLDDCIDQARERQELKELAIDCGNDDLLNY